MTTVNPIHYTSSQTNDSDLVELAGAHSYAHYDINEVFKVNGKKFRVLDTVYETDSGLDALTVQNIDSKELSVVFVGSEQMDKDWLGTNTKLLGNVPPVQVKEAVAYFNKVNEKIGEVSSVSGNSLAGALTNAVGIENPSVKAVTLNPAILPADMVDPSKDYPNITNYYSKYDFLTGTEESIGLGANIPGKKYGINNGIPLFSMLAQNHTGYVEVDENGDYTVEVGIAGQPGHGFIHVGADDHIVTSLWTGSPLYGGQTEKIHLNKENMLLLASGIQNQVKGRITHVKNYLANSTDIVEDESARFYQRVTILQETFQHMLEDIAGDPLFIGIAKTGAFIKGCIDDLIILLNIAEDKCRVLNSILNSKPAELLEFITSTNISVESLFGTARQYLYEVKSDINDLIMGTHNIIHQEIPELFRGGKDLFVDAVVGELDAHYHIVSQNKDDVYNQLNDYGMQIQDIANSLFNKEGDLASSIQSGHTLPSGVDAVNKTNVFTIQPSPYVKMGMKIKELQVMVAHNQITKHGMTILSPLLLGVEALLLLVEKTLQSIIFSVNAALNIGLYGNPISLLVSAFTNYEEKVKNAVHNTIEPLEELETTVEGLRKGISRMIVNLPEMLQNFKPYIDSAIFEPGKFEHIRLYNVSTLAILDEMELLFNDIIFQLSGEKAEAIEATLEISKSVLQNLQILKEQVNRVTL